jgi:ParB family transcriptional regulator, chromosome partitioning protein
MQASIPETAPAVIPFAQTVSPTIGPATRLAGALIGLLYGPVEQVSLDRIDRDPGNPRQPETPEELASLAASIKANGILQPLLLTPSAVGGRYDLLDGHRRRDAAAIAGLTAVPAIVISCPLTLAQRVQLQLVSSLQRADLKPCSEEAAGYETLVATHGYTLAQLGEVTGKRVYDLSRSLSLRKLPEDIQALIDVGQRCRTAGVELAKVKDPVARQALCERFRRTPLTREQLASAREARKRRGRNAAAKPLKRLTFRLGPQGATISVTCPDDLPELTTELLRDTLEFALQETRKALRRNLPAVKLAAYFQKIRPQMPAGTLLPATANGRADTLDLQAERSHVGPA